jgi:hypothetical protein
MEEQNDIITWIVTISFFILAGIGFMSTFDFIFLRDIPPKTLTFHYHSSFHSFDITCSGEYCYPKFVSLPGTRAYDRYLKQWAEEFVCNK